MYKYFQFFVVIHSFLAIICQNSTPCYNDTYYNFDSHSLLWLEFNGFIRNIWLQDSCAWNVLLNDIFINICCFKVLESQTFIARPLLIMDRSIKP